MTAVKSVPQKSSVFELRDLINVNMTQDKKGMSGDPSTQFWELLNKMDEDNRPLPKAPAVKNVSPQTKLSLSKGGDITAVEEDFSAEIATYTDYDKGKEILTSVDIGPLHSQSIKESAFKEQPIRVEVGDDKPIKITSPFQTSASSLVTTDNHQAKNDYSTLKNEIKTHNGVKSVIGQEKNISLHPDQEVNTVIPSSQMDQAMMDLSKTGRESQKVQIEMMPKSMDTTPLAVKMENFLPQTSPKAKFSAPENDQLNGQENASVGSITPGFITPSCLGAQKIKSDAIQGQVDQPVQSHSSSIIPGMGPGFSMADIKNNGPVAQGVGNKISSLNLTGGGEQKSLGQGAPIVSPLESKKITMAEKIQALSQARDALKAALEKGETHLKVQLVPDDLGKIEIKLDIDRHGLVQAMFMADHRETMEYIARYGQEFVQIFQDSGLQTDLNSMNFQSRHQQEERPQFQSQEGAALVESKPEVRRLSMTQIDIEV